MSFALAPAKLQKKNYRVVKWERKVEIKLGERRKRQIGQTGPTSPTKKERLDSIEPSLSKKKAATYSPAGVQYHRRKRA